jgi:hypothetical protein
MSRLIDRLKARKAKKGARSQMIVIWLSDFSETPGPGTFIGVVGGSKKAREALTAKLEKEQLERKAMTFSSEQAGRGTLPAAPDSARQPQRDNQAEPRENVEPTTVRCWRCSLDCFSTASRCPWCGAPTTPNVDHPDGICGTQP